MKLGTTTLVATVRNEGPYLWEWVAYHKSIGFDKLPSADYIVIIWRLFGSSYKNIPNFDLTTTRFHRADPDGILSKNRPWGYKTMFRPKQFVRAGVHKPMPINPNENFKIINASGLRSDKFVIDDWRSTDPKNRNLAQINHYIVRDAQSFVLKSALGRAHQIENQVHFSY